MALVFLSLGWLVGLYMGQMTGAALDPVDPAAGPRQLELWLGGLAALAGVAALLGRDDRRLWVMALALALGLLGAWRALSLAPGENPLLAKTGTTMLRGTVSGRPEPRDAALLLVLDVNGRWGEGRWESTRSRVLVRTDRYAEWSYGDRMVARGTLQAVDSGSGYWAEYLARQGIHATLEYPYLQLEERPQGPDPWLWIDEARDRLEEICARLFPEPQASLLAGILVGTRTSMPTDFRDALNATATSHIVAVSGFNVTVVAGLAQLVALRYLALRKATIMAILAVWLYSLLTGLPPSALRAAIMCTLGLLAVLAGRGGDALSFLCLSGAIMAGLDPMLLHDLGFQLSFLATAGLVLLEPALRGRFARLPGWLSGSLSVTLAAQLATLPILIANFHTLSLVSPLSNLLVAPVLPAIMVVGALAVALGALALPLGQLVAPLAWLYLTYLVEVISWTARFPGAALSTGGLEVPAALLYYLVFLAPALWPLPEMRQMRERVAAVAGQVPAWALAGALAALLSLGALAFTARPDGRVRVYFLDVGHGDATLVRGPEGHNLLVDGGPSPLSITSALGRRLGFLDRGVDAVVLTGYGEDRLAGLVEVARRHPIGLVVQPGSPVGRVGQAWAELLRERAIPVVSAVPGQRIPLGSGVWLEVLWTSGEEPETGDRPLVLRLVAGRFSVLLPGDLARSDQAELSRTRLDRVDVLRVPHHGGAGALDEQFLQALSPRVAVVSVQAGNRFDHPANSTVEMLKPANLFRTDRHGTVELVIGREGYELFTDR